MKRVAQMAMIAILGLVTSITFRPAAPQSAAPQWAETELPNGYCWNFGLLFGNCSLKPVAPSTAMPSPVPATVTPPPSASPVLPALTPSPSTTPTKVTPLPSHTPTTPPGGVELSNPDFELGSGGWQLVTVKGSPSQMDERALPGAINTGTTSLRFGNNFACFRAGVRQTVFNVLPFSRMRFSVWGRAYARGGPGIDFSRPNDLNVHANLFAGIDPQAGTDVGQSSIVWVQGGNPLLGWTSASTEVFAPGNRVTVWALINLGVDGAPGQPGNACEWALNELAGWLDTASLSIVP